METRTKAIITVVTITQILLNMNNSSTSSTGITDDSTSDADNLMILPQWLEISIRTLRVFDASDD